MSGTTVYVGGEFSTIGGQSRNALAAIDAATASATDWSPNADMFVTSIAVSGETVYAAGDFTLIGGQSRNHIAALDASTGNATDWDPNADSSVHAFALSGTTVFVGGRFTSIGGQGRNYIAALEATTGKATAWNPDANFWVYSLALSGPTVYAGGIFYSIGQGVGHPNLARFDEVPSTPVVDIPTGPTEAGGLSIVAQTGRLSYSLSKSGHVLIRLFTTRGQLLSELVNTRQDTGRHSVSLRRYSLAPGAYLILFRAGGLQLQKMMTSVR